MRLAQLVEDLGHFAMVLEDEGYFYFADELGDIVHRLELEGVES